MAEVLSEKHRIVSAAPEDMPKDRRGPYIGYLKDWDAVVIAGWDQNTGMMFELINDYLELTPEEHENALEVPSYVQMPGMALEIWQVLEEIYQIRNRQEERPEEAQQAAGE